MAPARGIHAPPGTCSSFLFIYFFIHVSHNDKKDERKLLNWIYTSINQNGSNLMFHAFLASRWTYRIGVEPASVCVCVRASVNNFKYEYF